MKEPRLDFLGVVLLVCSEMFRLPPSGGLISIPGDTRRSFSVDDDSCEIRRDNSILVVDIDFALVSSFSTKRGIFILLSFYRMKNKKYFVYSK